MSEPTQQFFYDHGHIKICPKCLKRYGGPVMGLRELKLIRCVGCNEFETRKKRTVDVKDDFRITTTDCQPKTNQFIW